MKLKFWDNKTPELPAPEPVVSEPVEKPVKERGYFETVAAADVTVRTQGETVSTVTSPEMAMKLATVYRCISILSGSIASLPLQLKRKKNGVFMVDEDNPLNYLLTQCPNGRQTAYEMIRNAIIQMVGYGNAYIYPDWGSGEVRSLTLLSPGSVSYDKLLNIYMVNDPVNNIYKTLDSDEIIHLRNMSLDGGYTGVSTIRYAANVMGVTAGADFQSGQNFRPGNTYKGFVSGNSDTIKGYNQYIEDQLADAAGHFRKELQSGETITYLPGDLKFNPLSMSPADIQLLEIMKFSVLNLCRFFGVHPDKAFAGQSQNYKASEMSQVQFMTDTLQPLLRQIENEFFAKLIPRNVASKYRIQFDIESFYQTDLETISNYNEKMIQNGISTVNELREKAGKIAVPGGDVAMISCNVQPLEYAINNSKNVKNENNSKEVPPTNGDNQV